MTGLPQERSPLEKSLNQIRHFAGKIRDNTNSILSIVAAGDLLFSAGTHTPDTHPVSLFAHTISDLAIFLAAQNIAPDPNQHSRALRKTVAAVEAAGGIAATSMLHLGGPDLMLPAIILGGTSTVIGVSQLLVDRLPSFRENISRIDKGH